MINIENTSMLKLIKQEKKLIITGLIAGFALFIFYHVFFNTALYETNGKIYVKNIEKSNFVANVDGGSTVVSESGYSNPLFNLYEILKSEKVADRVYPIIKEKFPEDLNALGAHSKEAFYDSYVRLISAVTEPSTDVISIKLMWVNKKHAPIVLYEIIKVFQEENFTIKKAGQQKKREIINEKTVEIAKQLTDVRNKIKNYKINAGISNVEVETENIINARIDLERQANIIDSQVQYNKRRLKEFAGELKLKNAEIALRATGIGTDPYLVKLSQELAVAKQNYSKLRAKFKDAYPDVIAVNNEITQLQYMIDNRKQETTANITVPRGIYDGASSEIVTRFAETQAETVSLQAQLNTLRKGINKLKTQEKRLPEAQMGLDDLRKLENTLENAYQSIKEKQLEAKIKESEIIDNIIVIRNPSNGSLMVFLIISRLIGFVLSGGLLGLALAYIKQGMEDKWTDLEEMKEITKQNILCSIPWMKSLDSKESEHILDAAYTNLAEEIAVSASLNNASVITFVSTNKSQPKSSMIERLAMKFAQSRKSVMLIDLVGRDTNEFELIGAIKLIDNEIKTGNEQNFETIHNILKGAINKQTYNNGNKKIKFEKIITSIEHENLNDYLSSAGFKYILNLLKNHYQFILINAPHGFAGLPEIQTLVKLSEKVILLPTKNTGRKDLMNCISEVSSGNDKILGIAAREENSDLERNMRILEYYRNIKLQKDADSISEKDTVNIN